MSDETIVIKDYANWVVADARGDCTQQGLELALTNGGVKTERATIEKNADNSQPGTPIQAGGIVSVVIFPLETREGAAREG